MTDTAYTTRVPIEPGDKGTAKELGIMSNLVAASLLDPQFPLWVRRKLIVEPGTDPRDVDAVFRNAFDYVKANIGYQFDPLVLGDLSVTDYVQSPHWTLFLEGLGDCLAMAGVLGAFAVAVGQGYGFRTLRADPARSDFSHVYAILGRKDPDTGQVIWTPADTTIVDGSYGEEPDVSRLSPTDFIAVEPT